MTKRRRYASILASLESRRLLMQDNTQQGSVDVNTTIVLNEAQFLEFFHEKIDPGARGPDHFCQSLLRHFGKPLFRLALLAILSEQQKSASQPLFAGVKKLVDQILLDADVS